jgi:hypothetical protein
MRKRPSPSLAQLFAAVETAIRRLIPPAPESRPVGSPVVFRHYL